MGKYMRKCRPGEEAAVGGVEVTQAVGVRTRSRAAAANVVVSKRRRPSLPPSSPLGGGAAAARAQSGSCYLKLRSRMLFMAPPAPASASVSAARHAAAPLPAGLSRCSSTASSVDASAAGQDRSLPSCGSDAAAKAGVPEGSASNNAESGGNRERRETTPSSHFPGDLSDLESDLAGSGRSSLPQTPATQVQVQAAARARVPPAAEIEEFFAAAEEAEARRFACKYNFDVARGVPLDSGRFEWTPAVSSS
ncbi:hypothetical protein ZWY2020_022669 [Hordeum vulgare]|nr:hypothetical protein ZWY2020_022669 [Hordeum vulgare]